jgi:hypothetical protein
VRRQPRASSSCIYSWSRSSELTNKPYSSAYVSEIVTIEVGEDKRAFQVHRGLLTFYSGYFKTALDGASGSSKTVPDEEIAEAQNGVIGLKFEEPAVFEEFVMWLYSHKPRVESTTKENAQQHYRSIVKLWIFADRRDIPLLMNEMIGNLQQAVASVWVVPVQVIQKVYEGTTEDSALRQMILHLFTSICGNAFVTHVTLEAGRYEEYYPKRFLLDWIKGMLRRGYDRRSLTQGEHENIDLCLAFHVHKEGVSCRMKGTKRCREE